MNQIYLLFIASLAVLSFVGGLYWNYIKTQIYKLISNRKSTNLDDIYIRLEKLETRNKNQRQFVRDEVKDYLTKLQK